MPSGVVARWAHRKVAPSSESPVPLLDRRRRQRREVSAWAPRRRLNGLGDTLSVPTGEQVGADPEIGGRQANPDGLASLLVSVQTAPLAGIATRCSCWRSR
jgi:hypothetical protein